MIKTKSVLSYLTHVNSYRQTVSSRKKPKKLRILQVIIETWMKYFQGQALWCYMHVYMLACVRPNILGSNYITEHENKPRRRDIFAQRAQARDLSCSAGKFIE